MAAEEHKPCLYTLHKYCVVYGNLKRGGVEPQQWATAQWIKIHCAMCVKSMYARAKFKSIRLTVVNTL